MSALLTAALISAGAGLAGSGINLFSGMNAANESAAQMNKYRAALRADMAEARAKEQYYENVSPLDTKSGRAMSTEMAQQLADVNTAAAGRNAVVGGQGFNTAATKNATSQLMAEYNRSLIKAHESNVVPQLNYYRSAYQNASQAANKARYDQAMANIQAASQAWQGVGQAINAGGSAALGFMTADNGNGTPTGTTPKINVNGFTQSNGLETVANKALGGVKLDPKIFNTDWWKYTATMPQ